MDDAAVVYGDLYQAAWLHDAGQARIGRLSAAPAAASAEDKESAEHSEAEQDEHRATGAGKKFESGKHVDVE